VAGSVRLVRQGRVVVAGVVVAGVAEAVIGPLAWLPGVIVAVAVMGVAIGYVNVVAISWVQARVDGAMIGRVMSLVMLMGFGVTPLSLAVSGWLIDLDATALFVASGLLVALTGVAALALGFVDRFDAAPITRSMAPDVAPGQ
jgi:hypothetical protein